MPPPSPPDVGSGPPGQVPGSRTTHAIPAAGRALRPRRWRSGALAVVVLISATLSSCHAPGAFSTGQLHVLGNVLVDDLGRPVRLRGVNRSGGEYACTQVGKGIFDGPTDRPSMEAMRRWGVNVVRLPLNETCWLGVAGVVPELSGETYQRAVRDYVVRLADAGFYVILSLHWSSPEGPATRLSPMPNRRNSPRFWRHVAETFVDEPRVILDLFNEPFPDDNQNSPEAWRCWAHGGTCAGVPFEAAGMHELLRVVREAGATQLVLLGGVQYAARLSRFAELAPFDPRFNLAASWHVYNFSWCHEPWCWRSEVEPLMATHPVVTGEVGQDDCGSDFMLPVLDWLDARGGSYLAWTWNTWSCTSPSLLKDWSGTPQGDYGRAFRSRLLLPVAPAGHWAGGQRPRAWHDPLVFVLP